MKHILEIADYKNDYTDMAAEKLLEKVLDQLGGLPVPAGPRARRLAYPTAHFPAAATDYQRIQVRIHQSREYGWAYEQP